MIKVFSPAYFAREDTKTPMRYAALSLIANTAGSVALFFLFRHLGCLPQLGIAVATTLGGWLNARAAVVDAGPPRAISQADSRLHAFAADDRAFERRHGGGALVSPRDVLAPWFAPGTALVVRFGALAVLGGHRRHRLLRHCAQVTGAAAALRQLAQRPSGAQ